VVLPDQFLPGIVGDRTELVVDEGDPALWVGDGDDGVFIECGFQVLHLLQGRPECIRCLETLPRMRSSSAQLKTHCGREDQDGTGGKEQQPPEVARPRRVLTHAERTGDRRQTHAANQQGAIAPWTYNEGRSWGSRLHRWGQIGFLPQRQLRGLPQSLGNCNYLEDGRLWIC
jgi:hypothetical protein